MNTEMKMYQEAPFPWDLANIVENWRYKPGWVFKLVDRDRGQQSAGLTLVVTTLTHESLHEDADTPFERWPLVRVNHFFIVPTASYNYNSWRNWMMERCKDVEIHEMCEFIRVNGERVFAPHHGEGEDPYTVWMIGDTETAKKTADDK